MLGTATEGFEDAIARNHHIQVLSAHPAWEDDHLVRGGPDLYCIRIDGQLGVTALSAFPALVPHLDGRETVLTGLLEDRSAVFGVLAQVEALGLDLIELRQIRPPRRSGSPGSGDDHSPG